MAYHIGRRVSIGIAKETTRATYALPSYFLPKMDYSVEDRINFVVDDSSVAVIQDAQGQDITTRYSEGNISGRLSSTTFGLWLLATLGTESATTLVQTGVYDHVFIVNQSASHQSLSISLTGPNESTGISYALCMVEQMDIEMEVNKYSTYKVSWRGNTKGTSASTASFLTTENAFLPQHAVIKIATNLAGLTASTAIVVNKAMISIKKNLEDDFVLGSLSASDRNNKQFVVEGSFELVYNDRSYIDTILLGDLQRALRFSAINTDVTIGASSNPTLTIDLAKVKLQEVSRSNGNDDIIKQTVKFKAYYSLADAIMISATLRNTVTTAY